MSFLLNPFKVQPADDFVSVPWDLTNAAFNGNSLAMTGVNFAAALKWAGDGDYLFVLNDDTAATDKVQRRDAVTPYSIAGMNAAADNVRNVSGDTLTGLYVVNDGSAFFVAERQTAIRRVQKWTMATPFLASGAVLDSSFSLVSTIAAPPTEFVSGLDFSPDGLYMIVGGRSSLVHFYSLTTPFVISSGVTHIGTLNVSAQSTAFEDVFYGDSGNYLYIAAGDADKLFRYSLPTPYEPTGGSFDTGQELDVSPHLLSVSGMVFDPSGSRLNICGYDASDTLFEFDV